MLMKTMRSFAPSLFAILVLALAGGCTHYNAVSVQLAVLPAGQLLPHHVVLVLDQELADYKHVYHEGGDTFIYSFGDPLQAYARQVAAKSFQQVDVVPSLESAAAMTSADLILIPRAIKSDVSIPVYGFDNENLTFVVSWTAKNRATQNTLWLTTITANSTETKWNVNVGGGGKLYQRLFDDLSLKTYNAIQEAPELRDNPH
jgi:hypothetical protein